MLKYVSYNISLPQKRLIPPIEVKCFENEKEKENFEKQSDQLSQIICIETQLDSKDATILSQSEPHSSAVEKSGTTYGLPYNEEVNKSNQIQVRTQYLLLEVKKHY